jgi:hypothetical protein
MPITGLFRRASADPAVISLMAMAFERACRSLQDTGQPEIVRELLAERIAELAQHGERDPREICQKALKAFGIESECD